MSDLTRFAMVARRILNLPSFFLFLLFSISGLEAQRHPQSAGPNAYFRDEPGTPRDPEWKQRPPFIRGPMDRYERGRSRLFLNAGDPVPYLNYANEDYILYLRQTSIWELRGGRPIRFRQVRWDRVGEYMGGSYLRAFSMEEVRSGSDQSGYSLIDHKDRDPSGNFPLQRGFIRMRAGHYSYHDLAWTVTAATAMRTRFTPLTLVQSHLGSVRIDVDYKSKNQGTLLYNRGRGGQGLFSTWAYQEGDDYRYGGLGEEAGEPPMLMYGFHLRRNEGKHLSLGGTMVNQVMAFPSSRHSDAFRGDLPYDMGGPRTIKVFIADDLPDEPLSAARVHRVDLAITGKRNGEAVRLTTNTEDEDFDDLLSGARLVSGGVSANEGGLEARGEDVVVYQFDLPADVTITSARFEAEVEGDYRIGVRQTHDFPVVNAKGEVELKPTNWPATPVATDARRAFGWWAGEEREPYFTVARSEGQGRDGENLGTVDFAYGMPTGQRFASIDWNANMVGLKLNGEFALNDQYYMYPMGDGLGDRSRRSASAYWVQGMKKLGRGLMDLGGEYFHLDPDYGGGYDSLRGGMPFHHDTQKGAGVISVTHEFPMVEDNDDDDQWPDDFPNERPAIGDEYPGSSSSQVFPGLDNNSDSISDIDRNENFVVDWEEAFLTYDSDPREFVYGIDFNNNDVPDFRENDDLPDYPYRRDQKGRHFFFRLNRLGPLGDYIAIGRYNASEIAGGRESEGLYLRYGNRLHRRGVGSLQLNYDIKRVKDGIPDHTYIFFVPPDDDDVIPWINTPDDFPENPGRWRPATPDPLLMRDSWVNTLFIESKVEKIRDLNIENSILWMRNSQAEIELQDGRGLLQPEDTQLRFGVVNKVDFSWKRGALTLTPKFKHRLLHEGVESEEDARRSFSDFIPILLSEYRLTANTQLLAGAQGFPLLPYRRWDRSDKNGTFSQTDYLGMARINSEYFGRELSYFFGYKRTDRKYSRLKDRNTKHTTLFVDLMVPF